MRRFVIEKWYNRRLHLQSFCPGQIYNTLAPGPLGIFQHLPAKNRWRPRKSYHMCAEPLALSHKWQIRPLLLHYVHKKVRWAWSRQQLLGQKPVIVFGLYIYIGKNSIEGARPPWSSILLMINYCLRVYSCRQKRQIETETKETISLFVSFLSLVAFQLRGGGPPGYVYAQHNIGRWQIKKTMLSLLSNHGLQ